MKQLNHSDIQNLQKKFPITIICDAIRTPENIGMCFRVSEGFGVQKIYLHETSPTLENRTVLRTARNTISQIESETYSNFDDLLSKLKSEGNTIIGIEVTDESIPVQNFNFQDFENIVFILGSERNGITQIQHIDYTVHIPMFGRNSSMNVIHSLSVVLYQATNQINIKYKV